MSEIDENKEDLRVITEEDLKYLRRSVELAKTALEKNDEPFGSVLVDQNGDVLFEDHNRVSSGDYTQHPEFAIARWAANNMTEKEKEQATVYTSGEHCPMCSVAHAWAGLGRIVYASSSEQLVEWFKELGVKPSRVRSLPIQDIIRDTEVDGPVPELADEVYKLHQQFYKDKI